MNKTDGYTKMFRKLFNRRDFPIRSIALEQVTEPMNENQKACIYRIFNLR